MAKNKKKLSKLKRQKIIRIGTLGGILLAGIILGALFGYMDNHKQPRNLVWAADSTVRVPADLVKYLAAKDDCQHYKGTDSPVGVGLWGVYQVSQAKYAKIAYGCSLSLSSYIMAVKQSGSWQLIAPTEYFAPFKEGIDARQGALPYCAQLQKYHIPKDMESFCVQPDGTAQANE